MDPENEEGLECAVTMRRYILKTKQTAWAKSSRRIIVWSPCLNLEHVEEAHIIPTLRQYPKQNHQDVRFLSKCEIENDASPIYKQEKVELETKMRPAHGMAVTDSPPGDGFSYVAGDAFWLYVESRKSHAMGTLSVPVVNLRTFKTGTILAPHVCWYPVARSPSGELWTFGGLEKVVRGAKKQNWIWAVIQSTEDETTVCDMIQVTPDCKLKYSERDAIFNHKVDRIIGLRNKSLPESYYSITPRSPQKSTRKTLEDVKEFMKAARTTSPDQTSEMNGSFPADQHPTKRQQVVHPTKCRRLSPVIGSSHKKRSDSRPPTPPHSRRYSSVSIWMPSPKPTGTYIPQTPESVYDEVEAILWSLFSSKPLDKPFLAADEIAADPTLIGAAYERALKHAKNSNQIGECGSTFCPRSLESDDHVREETAKLAKFCSNGDPHCKVTQILPHYRRQVHFHLPASKCDFTLADPGGSHIHCVTAHEWPGHLSGCIYNEWPKAANIPPGKNHTSCCRWSEKDRKASGYEQEFERVKNFKHPSEALIEFSGPKRKEALRLGIPGRKPRTEDRRPFIKPPELTIADAQAVSKDAQILREADLLVNFHAKARDKTSLSKAVMEKEGLAREMERRASLGVQSSIGMQTRPPQHHFSKQCTVPQQRISPKQHPFPGQQSTPNSTTSWQITGVSNNLGSFQAGFNCTAPSSNINAPEQNNPYISAADPGHSSMAIRSSNDIQSGTPNIGIFGVTTGFHNPTIRYAANQLPYGNSHEQNPWISSAPEQVSTYSNSMQVPAYTNSMANTTVVSTSCQANLNLMSSQPPAWDTAVMTFGENQVSQGMDLDMSTYEYGMQNSHSQGYGVEEDTVMGNTQHEYG